MVSVVVFCIWLIIVGELYCKGKNYLHQMLFF